MEYLFHKCLVSSSYSCVEAKSSFVWISVGLISVLESYLLMLVLTDYSPFERFGTAQIRGFLEINAAYGSSRNAVR